MTSTTSIEKIFSNLRLPLLFSVCEKQREKREKRRVETKYSPGTTELG